MKTLVVNGMKFKGHETVIDALYEGYVIGCAWDRDYNPKRVLEYSIKEVKTSNMFDIGPEKEIDGEKWHQIRIQGKKHFTKSLEIPEKIYVLWEHDHPNGSESCYTPFMGSHIIHISTIKKEVEARLTMTSHLRSIFRERKIDWYEEMYLEWLAEHD